MKWIKILTYNVVIAGILFLLVDFLYTDTQIRPAYTRPYATLHPDFNHTLKPSFNKVTEVGFVLCTDKNAFKTHCDNTNRSSLSFDVVFIGDSFTEGWELPYEETFVGMYDLAHPDIDVANLGVASYSPTRYLQKISYYLDRGLETNHVVVFIDYNDFSDEYKIARYDHNKLQRLTRRYFTYTNMILYKPIIEDRIVCKDETRYHPECNYAATNIKGIMTKLQYEGEQQFYISSGVIGKSLSKMEELYKLLTKHGIKLSLAVYPWPKHLKYDTLETISYVKIWEEFCKQKCFAFINTFTTFFA